MKTYVTLKIEGRVTFEVDVEETKPGVPDEDDVRTKALMAYDEADFGPLEDIEMSYVNYEDGNGRLKSLE